MERKRKAYVTPEENTTFDTTRFQTRSEAEDISFKVEGKKIYVSKTALLLGSPVFRAVLQSNVNEKEIDEIELKEKKYDDMVEFFSLIYPASGKRITMQNVFHMLPLANEYQVDKIIDDCEECLIQALEKKDRVCKSLYVKLVCHIQQQSSLYNLQTVEKKCIDVLSKTSVKEISSAEKVYPLPLGSKNLLMAKINLRLEESIKRLENDTEIKDEILDMTNSENNNLRQLVEEKDKEIESLKQRLSDLESENRTQGIIRMEFSVSTLTPDGVLSEPRIFRGLNWRCKVSREVILEPRVGVFLGMGACFDPGHQNIENSAIVYFKVINKKQNGPDFTCNFTTEAIFTSTNRSWGFRQMLRWEDFINPNNGYVVDNKATIEMFVMTFKPRFSMV